MDDSCRVRGEDRTKYGLEAVLCEKLYARAGGQPWISNHVFDPFMGASHNRKLVETLYLAWSRYWGVNGLHSPRGDEVLLGSKRKLSLMWGRRSPTSLVLAAACPRNCESAGMLNKP